MPYLTTQTSIFDFPEFYFSRENYPSKRIWARPRMKEASNCYIIKYDLNLRRIFNIILTKSIYKLFQIYIIPLKVVCDWPKVWVVSLMWWRMSII